MKFSERLAKLRNEKGLTQTEVADYISSHTDKQLTFRAVSYWEKGASSPSAEQFLLLCDLYGVRDVQSAFRGIDADYRNLARLNDLGKSRVEEYIAMLAGTAMFSEPVDGPDETHRRYIKLYDVSVAAGTGNFLDSDSYEDFEVDETVPEDADFAVRVSGDSMTPRFVDSQIIFIREQQWLDIGDIGIFALNGESYVKKLGSGELISLNPSYEPIRLRESDSFYTFGKVVG